MADREDRSVQVERLPYWIDADDHGHYSIVGPKPGGGDAKYPLGMLSTDPERTCDLMNIAYKSGWVDCALNAVLKDAKKN